MTNHTQRPSSPAWLCALALSPVVTHPGLVQEKQSHTLTRSPANLSTLQEFLPGRATGSAHSSGIIFQKAALRTRGGGVTQKETLLRVKGVGQSLVRDNFHGTRVQTVGGLKEVVKAASKKKPLNLQV